MKLVKKNCKNVEYISFFFVFQWLQLRRWWTHQNWANQAIALRIRKTLLQQWESVNYSHHHWNRELVAILLLSPSKVQTLHNISLPSKVQVGNLNITQLIFSNDILLAKLFWPTMRKNLVIEKNFWKNFKQWKVRTIFGNRMFLLTGSWRFFISDKSPYARHYNLWFVYFLPTLVSFMYCNLWPCVWLVCKSGL